MARFAAAALLSLLLPAAAAFAPAAPLRSPGRASSASSSLSAVAKKDAYSVTLLPGDGIGPEISAATKVALTALCDKRWRSCLR